VCRDFLRGSNASLAAAHAPALPAFCHERARSFFARNLTAADVAKLEGRGAAVAVAVGVGENKAQN
jgi:hypothetical protein